MTTDAKVQRRLKRAWGSSRPSLFVSGMSEMGGQSRKCSCLHGTFAGGDSSNGYWHIRIDGKGYLGHRLAWLYMHGHFRDGLLDHKNRDNPTNRKPAKSDAQPKRRKYKARSKVH